MKCPNCDGKGTVLKIIYEDWQKDEIVRSAVKCPRCNGSGEVSEVEMTNEEYLKSCTTEMLAVAIFRAICISAEMIHCEITLENRSGTELKEAIYEWLKEKHDE